MVVALGLLLLTIVSTTHVYGQWNQVDMTGIPNGFADVRAVAVGDGKVFISGTYPSASAKDPAGVYMSSDGGTSWSRFNTGLPAGVNVNYLLVDGTTIYAAATKNGVYFSSTSADNFTALAKGSLNTSNDFSVMEKVGNVLFLATLGKGLWKTDVTAHAWTQLGANNTNIYALKKDNVNGTDRLYVGVRTTGGFFYSVAPFTTFTQKAGSPNNIYAIAADGGQLFVGTSDNGFYSVAFDNTDASIYNFTAQNTGMIATNRSNTIAIIGSTIYQGTQGRRMWKSSTTLPLSWTSCSYTNMPAVVPMIAVDGTTMYVATNRGLRKSTDAGVTFTTVFNKETFRNWVTDIKEKNGKLYARADMGYYVSNSGNGGDWAALGVGLEHSATSNISVGNSGIYAAANSLVWKLNGANWEVKNQDFANDFFDMDKCNFQRVLEFNDGVNDVLIAGGWSNSAIFKSTDGGGTWATYDIATLTAGSTGLYFNSTTDQSQKIIFNEFAASKKYPGLIMATHKNRTQFSYDAGANWTWRLGNYKLNTGTSNIRSVLFRQYQGQEYFFMVTDITFGGAWSMANSVVDGTTNTGSVWTDLSASSGGESRNICEYSENLMFWRSGNPQVIRKSEDNGVTSENFDTGLPRATANSLIYNTVVGQYMYASLNNDANVTVYRYDLSVTPAIVGGYPQISGFGITTANIIAQATLPSKFYYVVVNPAAPVPTRDQIIAGTDGAGNPSVKTGVSAVVLHNTNANMYVTGLTVNTAYKVYVVAKSEVGTYSSVQSVDLQTANQQFNLTVKKNGMGNTTPDLGATAFNGGTTTGVSATSTFGWKFDNWTITGMGTVTTTTASIVMNSDITATANFSQLSVNITLSIIGDGNTSKPQGVSTVVMGSVNSITATPNSGSVFGSWIGYDAINGQWSDVSVTLTGITLYDVTITAVFLKQVTLTTTMSGASTGANVSTLGTSTFTEYQDVTITATPGANTRVQKWIVDGTPYLITTNVFSITLGNINSTLEVVFETASKIAENMISNLSIYPNPTNGMLFVKNEGNLKSITLYDLAGKAISVKQVEGKQLIEINASKFQKGVYMLRITDNKGNVANHKFVKE